MEGVKAVRGFDVGLNVFLLVITLVSTYKSTVLVLKTNTTEGVSLLSQVSQTLTMSTWIGYGFMRHDAIQIIANAVAVGGALVVLVIAHRCGRLRSGLTAGSSAGYGGVVTVGGLVVGVAAVATVGTMLSVANKVPQMVEAWKQPGGVAVSVPAFAMNGVAALGWSLFGGLQGDSIILGTSLFALFQAVWVVVLTLQGRRGTNTETYASDYALAA